MLTYLQTQHHQYLPNQTDFLIALSGGVDSVVLLHLFAQLNLNLRAIHIHHGLSPNANHWADFCEQLCKRWKIPFILQKVKVNGEKGIEASARNARYQAIREHKLPQEVVVTAHHLDDQAETFFLALKRGSGVKGLSGMQAVSFSQGFTLFRPLLAKSKTEILAYAEQQNLEWVEDESNASHAYDRNFLRHTVLPQLNQRWAHFNQMVGRASQHLANQQQLLDELLNAQLQHYLDTHTGALNIADFSAFSPMKQQALIRLWLSQQQQPMPSEAQLEQILKQMIYADWDKQPAIQLGEKWLRRYQHQLFLTPQFAETCHFQVQLPSISEIELPDGIGMLYRNMETIICKMGEKSTRLQLSTEMATETLTVKLHHRGKVKCYGKPHHEEMKKIWQAHSIPVWLRTRIPLIFWQNELVAVI